MVVGFVKLREHVRSGVICIVKMSVFSSVHRVSGKRGLADSAGNTESRILRLNHITCRIFITPRDVSDKMDGGEGSHGTSDTEYSVT